MVTKNERLIKGYYDKVAHRYGIKHGIELYGGHFAIRNKYLPILKKYIKRGDKVLEFGCGTGIFSAIIKNMGCQVLGSDISDGMINEARKKHRGIKFIVANTEKLPFSSNSFDVVVGINTLSYCHNKYKALNEIKRVLKRGGKIVIIDMNYLCPIYYVEKILSLRGITLWISTLIKSNRFYLSSIFKNLDLSIIECREFNWIPHKMSKKYVNLLSPIDMFLSSLPFVRMFAMRILMVGKKK